MSGYLIPKNTPILAHFINKNAIEIEVDDGLKEGKIRIELSIWGTDYEDVEIFENGSAYSIPKGYGENDWYLSYDEKAFGVFRHFKTNNWHDHDYSFHFYKKNGLIKCDVNIDGPNEASHIVELNKEIKTDVGSESGLRIKRK